MTVPDALKLENYERLLHQQARACYGRLQQAGVPIDYEDCYQEMLLAYCKAVQGYDPTKGMFSTYLVWACRWEFNRKSEKMIAERVEHRVMSLEDIGNYDLRGDEVDALEFLDVDSDEFTPEEALSRRQQVTRMMDALSPHAAMVLKLLRKPSRPLLRRLARHRKAAEQKIAAGERSVRIPELTISFICDYMQYSRSQINKVRRELNAIAEPA